MVSSYAPQVKCDGILERVRGRDAWSLCSPVGDNDRTEDGMVKAEKRGVLWGFQRVEAGSGWSGDISRYLDGYS